LVSLTRATLNKIVRRRCTDEHRRCLRGEGARPERGAWSRPAGHRCRRWHEDGLRFL